ncbi:Zinc-finger homeodomain protein 8 [Glycine soja]|nr:hypothetical protein JHK86_000469 [Glycine max]
MDLTKDTNTLDTNSQTPPQPFTTNGSLKHHHHPHPTTVSPPQQPPSTAVAYKECLKNHAASIGGHALDGCGEFMPSSFSNPNEPRSLTCAACGCHRNFHRRRDTPENHHRSNSRPNFLSFYHSPPPSRHGAGPSSSPSPSPMSSPSPPPISHHFPPSSHHFQGPIPAHGLLGLGNEHHHHMSFNFNSSSHWNPENSGGKKRHRTKFSHEQKEKMHNFAEKLGWRMQKGDEGLVQDFCKEIGVSRGVFKVWMHNNKNTSGRKKSLEPGERINGTGSDSTDNNNNHPYNTNSTNDDTH